MEIQPLAKGPLDLVTIDHLEIDWSHYYRIPVNFSVHLYFYTVYTL